MVLPTKPARLIGAEMTRHVPLELISLEQRSIWTSLSPEVML